MNDNREITISKEEYDNLKACQIRLKLYQSTLFNNAEYSEWRKSGVTFDEEKIYESLKIIDVKTASMIEEACAKQKADKEKAEKPSFPEIKKED